MRALDCYRFTTGCPKTQAWVYRNTVLLSKHEQRPHIMHRCSIPPDLARPMQCSKTYFDSQMFLLFQVLRCFYNSDLTQTFLMTLVGTHFYFPYLVKKRKESNVM